MSSRKTLLVYYSRTGTVRSVAQTMSRMLACDVEELIDTKNRFGVSGYLGAALDAGFHRLTTLKSMVHDPRNYDLVIVGTPVWNASVSAPVRTYLTLNKGCFKNVAFFCTFGGSGARRAFRQMGEICGKRPIRSLEIREAEVKRGRHFDHVRAFVNDLTLARAAA